MKELVKQLIDRFKFVTIEHISADTIYIKDIEQYCYYDDNTDTFIIDGKQFSKIRDIVYHVDLAKFYKGHRV